MVALGVHVFEFVEVLQPFKAGLHILKRKLIQIDPLAFLTFYLVALSFLYLSSHSGSFEERLLGAL